MSSTAIARVIATRCPPRRATTYSPMVFCDDCSEIGPAPLVPTGTAVPTLVLAGEFGPVTRSESRHVAALIGPNARWVEFLRIGHNVVGCQLKNAKVEGSEDGSG